jgi:hypothetical protein
VIVSLTHLTDDTLLSLNRIALFGDLGDLLLTCLYRYIQRGVESKKEAERSEKEVEGSEKEVERSEKEVERSEKEAEEKRKR